MRRGFTLVEMLVATAVFLLGFTACFALFLGGVRFRTRADDLTRLGLAASSLVHEIAIDSGKHGPGGGKPCDYVGNGRADDGAEADDKELYAYPSSPGIWYRVLSCTDLRGLRGDETSPATAAATAQSSPTLHLDLLVVAFPADNAPINLDDVARRIGTKDRSSRDSIIADLEARGLALRLTTALVRQPSWLP